MDKKILGAILPGNSTVELKEFDIPKPGHGQVLVKSKASTICGSDSRCIYRAHVGKGPEGYQPGMIAGHEPCGIIVEEGEGLKRFKKGDRVIVYHISGCGVCYDCRRGYYISCKSPYRAAYGWQRNGGMAPYMLCDEKDLIALPDELTYEDGAQVACGCGTCYEALMKIGVSGNDRVLQEMNRHYDREKYLSLIAYAKEKMPDLSITSDIIVGFPGETAEEFEDTLSLVKQVRYTSLFTFIFSPRPGTKAAAMPDPFDRAEKNRRFKALTDLQESIAGARTASMKGKVFRVLVEESTKDGLLSGRTEGNVIIEFPGETSLIGSFQHVEVTEPKTWILKGRLC